MAAAVVRLPEAVRSRCGTLLLYAQKAYRSGVRIIYLTSVELWGFEPQTSDRKITSATARQRTLAGDPAEDLSSRVRQPGRG